MERRVEGMERRTHEVDRPRFEKHASLVSKKSNQAQSGAIRRNQAQSGEAHTSLASTKSNQAQSDAARCDHNHSGAIRMVKYLLGVEEEQRHVAGHDHLLGACDGHPIEVLAVLAARRGAPNARRVGDEQPLPAPAERRRDRVARRSGSRVHHHTLLSEHLRVEGRGRSVDGRGRSWKVVACTTRRSSPSTWLMSDDLPTFGRPTTASLSSCGASKKAPRSWEMVGDQWEMSGRLVGDEWGD